MPLVNVMVNGRSYTVACDEGEEERLHELAAIVDGKAREIAKSIGQVGDTRLLLMTALLMADEQQSRQGLSAPEPVPQSAKTLEDTGEKAAEMLEQAAQRVGDIAARLTAA